MNAMPDVATALRERLCTDFPGEAADVLERLSIEAATAAVLALPVAVSRPVWERLSPEVAALMMNAAPVAYRVQLLSSMDVTRVASLLAHLGASTRGEWLSALAPSVQVNLRQVLSYPEDTAGRLMNPQFTHISRDCTVHEALSRLRRFGEAGTRTVYLVDVEGRLDSCAELQDLALAEPQHPISKYARPVKAVVEAVADSEEILKLIEQHRTDSVAVVDVNRKLIGIVRQDAIIDAAREDAADDLLSMVGASPDERVLSSPFTAVVKRLPWLQINLVTAFLAAAVVGMFEPIIAKFTALAVLLPVVAGQSGNTGAQAMAVTMRGLSLHEVNLNHWPRILFKEFWTGGCNGIAVALTTAAGVYLWSQSVGLVLIVAISMIASMIIAGIAGAGVPLLLTRLGQDPATASSIILTTITDVMGFFSFLGIAALLSGLL
jgi:magnesium transporter